jgi:hypothetical protein
LLRRAALVFGVFLLFACASASRIVHAGGNASVGPDSGSLFTQFTFSVNGLTPGHGVDIVLYDGDDNRFSYQQNGADAAIVVDDGGNASISMIPGRDLPGAKPGNWKAIFLEEETGMTVTIPFAVAPANA